MKGMAQIIRVSSAHRNPRRINKGSESQTKLLGNPKKIPLDVKML